MILYNLTDLSGRTYAADKVVHRGDIMFATTCDNGEVPIYSIKYNHEFSKFYEEQIYNKDIRDGGPSDNQGLPCGPH